MTDDQFTRSACAEPLAVRELRHAVSEFAAGAGFRDRALDDLRACVSEAVANAVMHAFRDGREPGTIAVSAMLHEDELVVLVCDNGVGYGPRTDSPGVGLGIPTIAALSSSMSISPADGGGTELCMSFARTRAAPFSDLAGRARTIAE